MASVRFVLTPWVALAIGLLAAAPGDAAPRLKNLPKREVLAGTTWEGSDSDGRLYSYTFEPDGTLAYKSPSGTYRNGTWKQDGTKVYFEMNQRYCEQHGQITGTTMKGTASNVAGNSWTWEATKRP